MAEEAKQQDTATPPATSGGITMEQVGKAIADAIGPVLEQVKGIKTIGADEVKSLIGEAVKAIPAAASIDDLVKAVETRTAEKAQAAAADAAKVAARAAARTAAIEKAGLGKVDPIFLASLPETEDAAALETAAKELGAKLDAMKKAELPNVGGAGGGNPPGEKPRFVASGLPDNLAKLAAETKLPGQA